MLRHLYKTLIISIMCGSLTTLNMSAYADTTTSSGMTTATPPSTVTQDKNGVYKKADKHSFNKVEEGDMLASITMLAVGTIAGAALAVYKPMTTDLMVAGAGGAAFMVGEVMSNLAYKNKMEDMTLEITKSSDGKKDQAQIDRLEDLKKSYEEAKKTTGTKKTLQMAAAAAFAAASAMAGYMAYTEYSLFLTCISTIKAQTALVATCPEAVASGISVVAAKVALDACAACGTGLGGLLGQMENINVQRQSPGPSMLESKTVSSIQAGAKAYMTGICKVGPTPMASITPVQTACNAALATESMNQLAQYKPFKVTDNNLLNQILFQGSAPKFSYEVMQSPNYNSPALIEKMLNLLIPKAEAGWLPLLGLGASAAATYFAITTGLGYNVDLQMFVPFNRSIAFAGLAALSFLAVKSSDSQMEKMDENIEKINRILSELNAFEKGVKANNVQTQQIKAAGFNNSNHGDIPIGSNPNVRTNCTGSTGNSNCPSLEGQMKNFSDFAGLPDSFKSVASQAAKMGDGLSGTNAISGATMSTAANLGNKANALSKSQKGIQSKLSDLLASNGQGKFDFDKASQDTIKKWNGVTAKALESKGSSASGFLSSLGMAPLPLSSGKNESVAVTPSKYNQTGNSGIAPSARPKDKGFNFDFKESEATGDATLAAAATSKVEEKFDVGENDINTNSGESIFQMISNRYIKSGYPKLLEEEAVKK